MAAVTSCQYNVGSKPKPRVIEDLRRLVGLFVIVCLNEVADRSAELAATGARVLRLEGRDRAKVAILLGNTVKVLSWGYQQATRRSWVGAWGAGPKILAAKWILWALVDDAGQTLTVAVTHMVPSVTRPAKGRIARLGRARRRAIYRRHVAAIVTWAKSIAGPIALHMDANAEPDFELLQPLIAAGFRPMTAPSHPSDGDDPRSIDGVWVRDCDPDEATALDGYSSDHKPVSATYTPQEAPVPTNKTITQRFVDEVFRLGGQVYTHEKWGSKPDGRPWPLAPDVDDVYAYRRAHKPHRLLPGKPVDTLWQHITVTEDDGPRLVDFFDDMQAVERIGFARFGSGVSYNIVVGMQGEIGIGMPFDAKGTHTVNDKDVPGFSNDQNYVSLAMAYLANDGDPLTPEAEASMVIVIQALVNIGALTRGFDYEPHSLVAFKDCPTDAVRKAMPRIHKAALGKEPQPTKVQRARVLFAEAMDLLEATPETRKRVHAALPELQQLLDHLPEK